jgi:hypothetical protein
VEANSQRKGQRAREELLFPARVGQHGAFAQRAVRHRSQMSMFSEQAVLVGWGEIRQRQSLLC